MTADIYDGVAATVMTKVRQAKGFISHAAGMGDDGVWTVMEVWESEEDGKRAPAIAESRLCARNARHPAMATESGP